MAAVLTAPVLCTREQVADALDVRGTSRSIAQIDGKLEGARDAVEGLLNRRFTPLVTTRYFDWPNLSHAPSWRLWLEESEVVSVTTLTAGGVVIPPADYNLEPSNFGPPYDRIDVRLDRPSSFVSGATFQRAISVLGVFGWSVDTAPAGALAAAITTTTATTITVTDSGAAGVGDLLLIGTERLLLTDKAMLTTAQTLQTPMTAAASNTTVAVTTGTAYQPGEVILLDSERMLITDVAGNNLTVRRAWDGTVLATHAGSTIYAPRTWTVVRGSAGTTAATALNGAAVTRHVVPGLIRELAVAESLNLLLGQGSGWARPAGAGASTRPQPGSLEDLRAQAVQQFGRVRTGVV
jgi:hypothetical protein